MGGKGDFASERFGRVRAPAAITYARLEGRDIATIKPLWEILNRLHHERSTNFKEHFGRQTFERRIEKYRALPKDRMFVGTAEDSGAIIGYVLATVSDDGAGWIDSLFVQGPYRTHGVGSALMERALAWIAEKGCRQVNVGVAEGNEKAFGFYRRFGFYPRMTVLVKKEEGGA